MDSAVSPEFANTLAKFTSKSPGYFPETSAALRQMGDYATTTAAQVEYMKVEAIATLSSLIASLIAEAALAFFFPEIGLELMAAECAAVRAILNTLVGRLLMQIVSASVIGVGIQVLLDSIAQAVLIGEGIQKTWNWEETGLQVGVGLLGAGMGLVLHPIQEWASHELANVIKGFVSHDAPILADNVVTDAVKEIDEAGGNNLTKDLATEAPKPGSDGPPLEVQEPRPDVTPETTGPGWRAPTPVGTRDWVIDRLAEIPTGIVIGGIHNAGHETLFNLMRTGQLKWSWETFAGGASQALTRPIGVLMGGGARMAFGLPMPAENLLAGALGSVTPSMLNDIANAPAELPANLPETGGKPPLSEPGASGSGNENGVPSDGKGLPSDGSGSAFEPLSVEPPAVQLLRAVGITPGPDTAYSIAVRTGFVPTTGPAEFHSLWARPVMVTLPPGTTSVDMAAAVRPVSDLPAGPGSPAVPPPAYEPAPAYSPQPVQPGAGGQPGSLLDEPLPASAEQFRTLTPDNVATPGVEPHQVTPTTQTPQSQTPQSQTPQSATPRPETQRPETSRPETSRPETQQPVTPGSEPPHGDQPVASPLGSVHHAAIAPAMHADLPPLLGDAAGGQPSAVLPGSVTVFDGSGQLQHVVLPNGVSYERNLAGEWSAGREGPGQVIVVKTSEAVTLTTSDGTSAVELPPESEKVLDQGTPVAYRQVRGDDGARLAEPRVFLPDGQGGWTRTSSPVETATYEAWLASANQAHGAAQTLHDIAGRSSAAVPEAERLTSLDDAALKGLLGGSQEDAAAAIYEWVRRREGVSLRWTQVSASHALADGRIVNMAAGEGKSWLFLVDAARQAVRDDVGAVHVITTRGNLADREFERYHELLTPLGFDVHRMNSDNPPPVPVQGRPTIYIGTSQDVGFTFLKTGQIPGEDGTIRIDAGRG